MNTASDIIDMLYPIINVPAVTGIITGEICRWKPPLDSEKEDIAIGVLDNREKPDVQPGIVNINCYCRNLDNGMPNEVRLKTITDAVLGVLEAYNKTPGKYFRFRFVWQNIFPCDEPENMSKSNIRLNTFIENL